MTDRPILFSAPMVRAILEGRKTQTRRVIKPQPIVEGNGAWRWEGQNGGFVGSMGTHVDEGFPESAKYWVHIQHGDRLWVREAWRSEALYDDLPPSTMGGEEPVRYEADGRHQTWGYPAIVKLGRYRHGMFMPRWASRITLEVTDVHVERLQDISEADAIVEGIECDTDGWRDYLMPSTQCCMSAVDSYRTLWNHINGPDAWQTNPWVGAYTFNPIFQNIDNIEREPSPTFRPAEGSRV